MKTEITLGRSPENDLVIDQLVVGRFHLNIRYVSEGELILEDLDTKSYTFINGIRIRQKQLFPTDILVLGNYPVDVEKLFSDIIKIVKASKTDYSSEFRQLQLVYSFYEKRISELKKKSQIMPMIIKSGVTIVFVAIAFFTIHDPQLRYIVMTVAGFLGGFITLSFQEDSKFRDEIDILTSALELEYKCPKCGKNLSGKRWQHWASRKKCDKCDAIWVE